MKRLLCVMAFGFSGIVTAGQLEDANNLLSAKAYDKAFTAYANLAKAGNTEAQFRLGEMYWYGDGTAPDLASANVWLQKAAHSGHAGAIESLAILKQRETRAADIAYWTSGYKGNDLVSGKFACPAPTIPALSVTTDEIKSTSRAYTAWRTCYNDFVANLESVPVGQRIPADVVNLMTPREAEQAIAHLNAVVQGIVAQSNQQALAVGSSYKKWETTTERRVADNNTASRLEYEVIRRQQDDARVAIIQNARPVTPPPSPVPGK